MRVRTSIRIWVGVAVALAISSARGDVQPQVATITIQPRTLTAAPPECQMTAADGTKTWSYTTAAAENGVFFFTDPLPTGALLYTITVDIARLATCQPANLLSVTLNPQVPGVDPAVTQLGSAASQGSVTICSLAQFSGGRVGGTSLITPDVTPYVRGGTNEIHVAEVGSDCSVRIDTVTVTIRYFDPAQTPRVLFDLSASSDERQRSILMHKFRSDDSYLSDFQNAVPLPWVKDNHVMITGFVMNPDGTPYANQSLYLRAVDPPDPSDYVPPAESHRSDDPFGWYGFVGNIYSAGFYWQTLLTDAAGHFSAVLGTEPSFAGSNQQIEASAVFLPYLPIKDRCTPSLACYTSGIISAWRRIYIENDRMFRAGAFVTRNAAVGDRQVEVSDGTPFAHASHRHPLSVLFIHAPAFPGDTYRQEAHTIDGVSGHGTLHLTHGESLGITLAAALSGNGRPVGDAVGPYAGDGDVYPVGDLAQARTLFATAYTDVQPVPSAGNRGRFVPYVRGTDEDYAGEVAERWFDSGAGNNALPNHVHVVNGADTGGITSATIGTTLLHRSNLLPPLPPYSFAPVVFVWNGQMELLVGSAQTAQLLPEVLTHELVHTFDVNQPVNVLGGHCTSHAWNSAVAECLMKADRSIAQRLSGNEFLHNDPWATSEYRRIRRRPDPVPQFDQDTFTPNY